MRLSPPKKTTFLICLVLIGLGLVCQFTYIPLLSDYSQWLLSVGGVVLLLGCLFRGL